MNDEGSSTPPKSSNGDSNSADTPSRMLSIVELCNDESADNSAEDMSVESDHQATNRKTKVTRFKRGGYGDNNRLYCNICKDGGELLCCDRCPRSFHMACLHLTEDDLPNAEWYCRMCAECLDRRAAKRDRKERARILRETEQLERKAKRQKIQQQKEERLAQKSVEAIEQKAKRVLDMQDRILSKRKVKYKDQEEEKLGKIAEDLAQTVKSAKEKLEKLEKEDASLKKKEEALSKKRKQQGVDEDNPDAATKPNAIETDIAKVPKEHIGELLAAWDCIFSFRDLLELSPVSLDQFAQALMHQEYSPLVTEVHMCLLDLILADREEEDYASDDEGGLDEMERYRYEIRQAPLTVGVPTSNMLNTLSWPSVLSSLIASVPRHLRDAGPALTSAAKALETQEYPRLALPHKLSFLSFLISKLFATARMRRLVNVHSTEAIQATKDFNRWIVQERTNTKEEEKALRTQQMEERAALEDQQSSVKGWLQSDSKKEDEDTSETLAELDRQDTELEREQEKDEISRHEYLSRKKKLDQRRHRLRAQLDKKEREQVRQEQLEKKKAQAKEALEAAITCKDASHLRKCVDTAAEYGVNEKLVLSARHVAEVMEADARRQQEEADKRLELKQAQETYFVRSEPLGKDRQGRKYWLFRGDASRLHVEIPGSAHQLQRLYDHGQSYRPSRWLQYHEKEQVEELLSSLDPQHSKESALKTALEEYVDDLLDAMTSDDTSRSRQKDQVFTDWRNKEKVWRKAPHDTLDVHAFSQDLVEMEDWLGRKLEELGSNWQETHKDWVSRVQSAQQVSDLIQPVLDLEKAVVDVRISNGTRQQEKMSAALESEKCLDSDDEEEEEEKSKGDLVLWPTWSCRRRWLRAVRDADRVSSLAVALASLHQRLEICGITETPKEVVEVEEPKKESKEREKRATRRATQVKKESSDKRDKAEDWEEDCYVCKEGGEVLCCDGCPRVFHYPCIGLRRVPRGKIYCHKCDNSNEPVPPVQPNTRRRLRKASKSESEASDASDETISDASEEETPKKSEKTNGQDLWDTSCCVCRVGGDLLCCDGCPRAFHTSCIDVQEVPSDEWFCNECIKQECGICKQNRIRLDSHVICGSEDGQKGCERVFHLECVGLKEVPEGDWFCSECTSTMESSS